MWRKQILPMLVLALSMSACAGAISTNPTPTPSSGVEGTVTQGPMCPGPVRVGDNSCPDQPYQATIDILTADKTQVMQVQADGNGYFKAALAPGTYILHPIPGKPFPHASDQTVVVSAGQYTQVSILYDTGMR